MVVMFTFILVLVLQGNAATKLRCGGKFFILVISYFRLILTVKEFLKSTNICQSYSKNKSGPVFSDSQCSTLNNRLCANVLYPITSHAFVTIEITIRNNLHSLQNFCFARDILTLVKDLISERAQQLNISPGSSAGTRRPSVVSIVQEPRLLPRNRATLYVS